MEKQNVPNVRRIQAMDTTERYTFGEEIAHAVSHGAALLAAIAAAPLLIIDAVRHGDAGRVVGASIFAATIILLYTASTLYHALPIGRFKRFFRFFDHGAIYLLIAGTYTPFTLGVLRGPLGWTLFGVVWSMAALGLIVKAVSHVPRPGLSTAFYVAMGWVGMLAAKQVFSALPKASAAWLIAGGVFYTGGVAFYVARRLRYAHFVWHLFVVGGTACHVA